MGRSARMYTVLVVGMALALAGCTGDSGGDVSDADGDAQSAQGGSTSLVVGPIDAEPPTYDYTQANQLSPLVLLTYNVVEPLLERMEDGSLEPLLAESYEVSDDGLEYLFTIRQATFHDGGDLTADDVVYSLELNRAAPNESVSGPLSAVEQIEKVDDRTVRVRLSVPSQKFLQAMSRESGMVIPDGGAEQLASAPVGTGPFVFDNWQQGVDVTLTRFEEYWGDLPFFEDITWRFIPDQTAGVNALLAGEVSVAEASRSTVEGMGVDPDATEGVQAVEQAGQPIFFAFLNAKDPAFEDERVRQAIAHAIDRDALGGQFGGEGQATCLFVNPPTEQWNSDHCPYPYDPERSRELLAEAGAEDLSIGFKYPAGWLDPEILAAQLTEVGINVEQQAIGDFPRFIEETESGDYQMGFIGGSQQADAFTCPAWLTADCVPGFDDLLVQADRSTSADEWAELRRQAVEEQADRAYLIPLYNVAIFMLVSDELAGVKPFRSYVEFDLRGLHWAN